jgi:hypothetical protein
MVAKVRDVTSRLVPDRVESAQASRRGILLTICKTFYEKKWMAETRQYALQKFIEDDVFFHSEETLRKVDTQFPDSDLLTQGYQGGINKDGKRKDWMWNLIVPTIKDIDPPYYSTMICAARMSGTLLKKVGEYVSQHRDMFFLEAFFPTLAHTHGLRHDEPPAMQTIVYRREWLDRELSTTTIFYHPIKDILRHARLRQRPTKDAVFLLCRTPHPVWLDFLSTFVHYQVYILTRNQKQKRPPRGSVGIRTFDFYKFQIMHAVTQDFIIFFFRTFDMLTRRFQRPHGIRPCTMLVVMVMVTTNGSGC